MEPLTDRDGARVTTGARATPGMRTAAGVRAGATAGTSATDGSTGARIGLLGCGTVGTAVVRGLTGTGLGRVTAVAMRDLTRARPAQLDGARRSRHPHLVAVAPDVDVVIEVMGGVDVALRAIRVALERGRPVVTANKALIAAHGPALEALAHRHGTVLRYDAAVAGALPAVGTVDDLARVDRIRQLEGVLNGTANHVLCAVQQHGWSVADAVADAQRRGYAEADPTRDLDGTDAGEKLVILARLAWGGGHEWARRLTTGDVEIEGIQQLDDSRFADARASGDVWRLVARATSEGGLRVAPVRLPQAHPLAAVAGADNGLRLDAELAGRLTLTGPGAGGDATAAAVLRDVDALVRAGMVPDGPTARA